jgi:hypothetical protein
MTRPDDETKRNDFSDVSAHLKFVESASAVLQTARNLAVSAAADLEKADDLLGTGGGALEEVERGIIESLREKLKIVRDYREFVARKR